MVDSFTSLKRKEIYYMVTFVFAYGLSYPSFGSYHYMFNLNIAKITKMQIADLSILCQIMSIPSTLLFNASMKNSEMRHCMIISTFLSLFQAFLFVFYAL